MAPVKTTIVILLAGFLLLAQAPVAPSSDAGSTHGDLTDITGIECRTVTRGCVEVSHPRSVRWTTKEFKDYCGTLTDCKIPDDVLVVPSADEQLDERIKYLEQTVQNQQLDIFTLQRDVRELQAKVEKEP